MNKIIVQVFLPANGESYDVRIPENMYVYDLANILADLFSETAKGFYCKSSQNLLCLRDTGQNLPQNQTLAELHIHNKTRLMLV